jgi:hypothetical protein
MRQNFGRLLFRECFTIGSHAMIPQTNTINPDFKPIEFDRFKNEAGNSYFLLSPQKGINALLIQQGLSQGERLVQLNKAAIAQMKSLVESSAMKKLK